MKNRQEDQLRLSLAQEAARIIQNEGVKDYQLAKRKAADRMNVKNTSQLPRNSEIQSALKDHLMIFHKDEQQQLRKRYLLVAHDAMQRFSAFSPRLAGSLLECTVSRHSNINLHLFADSPEDILVVLLDANISYRIGERRLRFSRNYQYLPCVQFDVDDVEVDMVIFPLNGLRQAPLSKIDSKPMRRLDEDKVTQLLQTMMSDTVASNEV